MISPESADLLYLVAAVLFILTFKLLSNPEKAIQGNLLGSTGMMIAVLTTVARYGLANVETVIASMAVGGLLGVFLSVKVPMTAMPQMVGIFNGLGGGASLLVAGVFLIETASPGLESLISATASGIIGSVTFAGSMLAASKLQFRKLSKPILFKGIHGVAGILLLVSLIAGAFLVHAVSSWVYWLMVGTAMGLGVLLVMPIGGADMPIVICLLNSYSGLAAAATGFVLQNSMLVIAGSLVGTSGIILTNLMCKAMNRSFINVLVGGFGAKVVEAEDIYAGRIKRAGAEDVAAFLKTAKKVVVVPGYGMAVAQAHYPIKELLGVLQSRGVEVEFGIHPVAGRMPGHMNVLLAEAGIPYELMKGVEEINPAMEDVDVAIVVGANDTVNPTAEMDQKSPIGGMPIIQAYKARVVVVIKRSLAPGFSGIPNPLFSMDNCFMYFSDARKAILEIITELKGS